MDQYDALLGTGLAGILYVLSEYVGGGQQVPDFDESGTGDRDIDRETGTGPEPSDPNYTENPDDNTADRDEPVGTPGGGGHTQIPETEDDVIDRETGTGPEPSDPTWVPDDDVNVADPDEPVGTPGGGGHAMPEGVR